MSHEVSTKAASLLLSLSNVLKKRKEYLLAIQDAEKAASELMDSCHHVINQPHIVIDNYEIDN